MNEVVSIRDASTAAVSPGACAVADLEISVAEGYHLQANPPSLEFLVPLTLSFRKKQGLRAVSVTYPQGAPYHLEGFGDLDVYQGTFTLRVGIEAGVDSPPGDSVLRGRLRYQACDDRTCLFPAAVPVSLRVHVLAPDGRGGETNPLPGLSRTPGLKHVAP